ncbi:MAG: mechanosensitive ion channel [Proteobacteria bacterium]|nr:mechanosensitive ion channel [Pseudomonadota bacterium]
MNLFRRFVLFAILCLMPTLAFAVPLSSMPAAPKPSGFIPVAAEIGQQIQALVTGGDPKEEFEPKETYGTRLLNITLETFKLVVQESAKFFDNFAALPQFLTWYDKQASNPTYVEMWSNIGQVLLLGLGAAFALSWLVDLLLIPLRRRIYVRQFSSAWAKVGGNIWWLVLALIPVLSFLAAALFVVDASEPEKLARYIVMTLIYAFTILKLVRVVLKLIVMPRSETLRFTPVTKETALFVLTWGSWISMITIFNYFLIELAKTLKMPSAAISGFGNITGLIIVAMAIAVILKMKSSVSVFLRGDLSAARRGASLIDNMRLWLARTWHVLAIGYLIVGYFVMVMGDENGFYLIQRGTIGTVLTLFAMRLGFYFDDKLTIKRKDQNNGFLRTVFRYLFTTFMWVAGALGIMESWGADVQAMLNSPWGQRVLGSTFSIVSTVVVVTLIYEILHRGIERHLNRVDENGKPIQSNSRARTLLPMLRKAMMIFLGVIVVLVTLAELGVNIAPILAGAGVLGVAVGFGSQTLVKDFLTGLFIILEDNMAVGDIVTIGSDSGKVEDMSLRTVRLRDVEGALHIVPFSQISTIVNASKDFSFAVIDASVAYDSDLAKVKRVLEEVAAEMRADPDIKHLIIEDWEWIGVQTLGDSSITIRGRLKTVPGEHYGIRRKYQLLMKEAFDKNGIEIPFPVVTHITKNVPENPNS